MAVIVVAKYELSTTYQNMYIKNINQLIPGASKTQTIVGPVRKKTCYFEKNQVLVKKLDLHKFIQIGGACIKFLLIT